MLDDFLTIILFMLTWSGLGILFVHLWYSVNDERVVRDEVGDTECLLVMFIGGPLFWAELYSMEEDDDDLL